MINTNRKSTILMTSIMLSAILVMTSMSNAYAGLPPNAQPLGCTVNAIENEISVNAKGIDGLPFIFFLEIANPDDGGTGTNCDFIITQLEVTWPDGTVATDASCTPGETISAGNTLTCNNFLPGYIADAADQNPPTVWVTALDFSGVVKTDPIDSNVVVFQDFPTAEVDVALELDKTGPLKVLINEEFVYTYTAKNTGDLDAICALTDAIQPGDNPVVGIENNPNNPANFLLAAGQTEVFTSVAQSHATAGTVDDLARLNCTIQEDFKIPEITSPWTVEVERTGLSINVECQPPEQDDTDDNSIDWEIKVTNTGTVDQSGINLVNGIPNCTLDVAFDGTVEAGATDTLTCTVGPDLTPGDYAGNASVDALDQNDNELGANDDDLCKVIEIGGAGCTPGFWKNNADKKDYAAWPAGSFEDVPFADIFGRVITIDTKGNGNTITDPTLEEALAATGGGINALARHGTAAYLNSIDAEVLYPISTSDVISTVQTEIDNETFDHSELAEANELGCTQNQKGEPQEQE